MNKYWLAVIILSTLCASPAWAGKRSTRGPASLMKGTAADNGKRVPASATRLTDEDLVKRFTIYKAKKNLSTYRTAQFFGSRLRLSPEQVLKRYVGTRFNNSQNGDAVIVEAINAFKESGLSYQQSLAAVSDIVGQLTETLNSIYTRASGGKIAQRD